MKSGDSGGNVDQTTVWYAGHNGEEHYPVEGKYVFHPTQVQQLYLPEY